MAPDLDRLRLVVENLPVVSYTIDRDGSREDVQWISGSIERLTGYTPQEWVADPDQWFRVVHPEDL